MNSFVRGDEKIWITELPGLKKPVLMMGNKNVGYKLASFNNRQSADYFCERLKEWFGAVEEEGE